MEQGTCGEQCVRGTLWSRVRVGSSVLGVPIRVFNSLYVRMWLSTYCCSSPDH